MFQDSLVSHFYFTDSIEVIFYQPTKYRDIGEIEYPDSLVLEYSEIIADTIYNSPFIYTNLDSVLFGIAINEVVYLEYGCYELYIRTVAVQGKGGTSGRCIPARFTLQFPPEMAPAVPVNVRVIFYPRAGK